MRNRGLVAGFCALFALSAGGCSTVMEATRPDPVDLDKFKPGEARIDIIAEIGSPTSSVKDQDKSCDVYQLYTHGPGAWGKAGIAFGEAAADAFTLGLAEVVATPAEAATRNKLHTVLFCYGSDDRLAVVHESGVAAPAANTQGAAPTQPALPSQSPPSH